MGKGLWDASPPVQKLFATADETLGFPLSRLCFEGPENELTDTYNAQPAILTVSIASLEHARETGKLTEGEAPSFVAGHSLGEFSALVAAGVLTFPEALLLVRERGRLMKEAAGTGTGLVALLGLDEPQVNELCAETGTEIANINCPGQIAVGGSQQQLDAAIEVAKRMGVRAARPLRVSAAFHTSWMKGAADGMNQALDKATLRDPEYPVIGNVEGRPLVTAEGIRAELRQQLVRPVLWQQSIEYLAGEGVSSYIETAPGRVLTGLIKRIQPDARLINLDESSGD
jgi:[acyl-carrier-protein] S-malonyltransferase